MVVGDFGDGGEAEYAVASEMARWSAEHPELQALVTTGDNFYVADVDAAWFEPYWWVEESGLPVWAVPGNHDIDTPEQREASIAAFGEFPTWRTRTVGEVTLVLLDSNRTGSDEQTEWLEQTVAGLDDRPWIAVFHFPLVSCGEHESNEDVAAVWGDLLQGASLILNGHDHNYQRFETERGWTVVTGGGGRGLYELGDCDPGVDPPVASAKEHHFLGIHGGEGGFYVEAIGTDGGVIDSFWVNTDS